MSGDRHDSRSFPSTCWSRLVTSSRADEAEARRGFEELARRYHRPIAAYVRSRWAKSDEEAVEAAQEFFLWMLETGFLARADPERGSFRGFVKRSLANFLHDLERRRRTEKRGGTRRTLSLDGEDEAPALEIPDSEMNTPEAILDDLWRRELLAQAERALAAELAEKGKTRTYEVFRDYFLSDEELDYATLAERHGISKVDVSNALAAAKRSYRAHLKHAVRDTVQGDQDLRAELSWLFEETPPTPAPS